MAESMITVRCSKDLHKQVKELAEVQDASLNIFVVAALRTSVSLINKNDPGFYDALQTMYVEMLTEAKDSSKNVIRSGVPGSGRGKKKGPPPSIIDRVRRMLFERSKIAIIWSVGDVQEIRKDLSRDDCMNVLMAAERQHDATIGINWEVLLARANTMFPMIKEPAGDEDET